MLNTDPGRFYMGLRVLYIDPRITPEHVLLEMFNAATDAALEQERLHG